MPYIIGLKLFSKYYSKFLIDVIRLEFGKDLLAFGAIFCLSTQSSRNLKVCRENLFQQSLGDITLIGDFTPGAIN